MRDLSYFNLGFRSDYVYNQLLEIESGKNPDTSLFHEAVEILKDFVKIGEEGFSYSFFVPKDEHDVSVIVPLLLDIFPDSEHSEILVRLRKVLSYITSLQDSNVDIESQPDISEAIVFFSNLSDACLSRSASSVAYKSLRV